MRLPQTLRKCDREAALPDDLRTLELISKRGRSRVVVREIEGDELSPVLDQYGDHLRLGGGGEGSVDQYTWTSDGRSLQVQLTPFSH